MSFLVAAAGLVALVGTLAAAAGAAPSAPACTIAAARAQVKATRAWFAPFGQRRRIDPAALDSLICHDLTRDGRVDLAATIASGGTAGDVGWIVFVGTAAGWRLGLVRAGYKLGLARVGSDLVETLPVYAKDDPNCCPSLGFDHTLWRWNGTRFTVAKRWHDRRARPAGAVYGRPV